MWRGGELEKDTFKRSVWGTVFSFCAKIPCFTPPTNIHLSEQVFALLWQMCLHNEGRCEVAALRSMCCIRILSFWVQAISEQPFSLQGQTMCSTASMCVMNETGTFFSDPAFLIGERINTALYKMVAGDLWFHCLSQHLSLWPGVGPHSDWCLYHLLSSWCASLHCQTWVWTHLAKGGLVCDVCFSMPCLFFFQYMHKLTLYFIVSLLYFSRDIAMLMLVWLTFSESKCSNMAFSTVSFKKSGFAQWFMFALKLVIALAIWSFQRAF